MNVLQKVGVSDSLVYPGLPRAAVHGASGDQLMVGQLLAMLWRRKILILISGVLAAALAFVAGTYFAKYSAKALIAIETQSVSGSGAPSGLDDQSVIETHVLAMTSDAQLRALLSDLEKSGDVKRGQMTLRDLEKNLKASQELHSKVVSITVTGKNAALAAEIANREAQVYLLRQQGERTSTVEQNLADVRSQIESLRAEAAAVPADDREKVADADRRLRAAILSENILLRHLNMAKRQELYNTGIRVLSPATVPDRTSSVNPVLLVPPGLLAGAILGIFAALLLEMTDRTLRSAADVQGATGLPCYAIVPDVRHATYMPRPLGRQRRSRDALNEALRSLFIAQGLHEPGANVIMITSSVEAEGKSTLARNLASCSGHMNRRTLLVDLDWRSSASKTPAPRPAGFFDVLSRTHGIEEVIQPSHDGVYDLMAVGNVPLEPHALLAGPELVNFLERLRARYDVVLIDTASIHTGSETSLLAAVVDRILVSVRWGRTRRDIVQNAIARLIESRRPYTTDAIGTVVTRANLKRHARYRFGDAAEVLG